MVLNPRTNLPWGEIKALTRSSLLVALEPHRQLEWQGSPFSSRPQAKTHDGLGVRFSQDLHSLQPHARSEEHTSELQSLTNLVCRLLLEKKKKKKKQYEYIKTKQ